MRRVLRRGGDTYELRSWSDDICSSRGPVGALRPRESEEEEEPAAPVAGQTASSWIEIELRDEDGRPVPSEAYRIELPDGSVREGALGSNGRARVRDILPGTCRVTYPNLDTDAWVRA